MTRMNLKKRLISLGAAALMCVSAVAGFGNVACAKQVSDSNVDILAAGSKGFTGGETGTAKEDPMEALMEMLFGEGSGYSSGDDSVGNTVSFETNFWATWCPHCVEELPELEKFNKELEAQGCQVIGICEDADTDAAEAKKILGEKGVTYTNIGLVKEMYPAMPHKAMPTTYFVDSEGRVLTKPVVGANVELCRERLAEALAAAGK